MQKLAVSILRPKKPGIVALVFKKTYRENWWVVVVRNPNSTRKHAHSGKFPRKSKKQLRPITKARPPRLEAD